MGSASRQAPTPSHFTATQAEINPVSDAAREWLDENVVSEPTQWIDGTLYVDFRLARDMIAEIGAAGFRICR